MARTNNVYFSLRTEIHTNVCIAIGQGGDDGGVVPHAEHMSTVLSLSENTATIFLRLHAAPQPHKRKMSITEKNTQFSKLDQHQQSIIFQDGC